MRGRKARLAPYRETYWEHHAKLHAADGRHTLSGRHYRRWIGRYWQRCTAYDRVRRNRTTAANRRTPLLNNGGKP